MVLNVKKLLNVGLGLTLLQKAERTNVSGMSGRSSGFTSPKAGFCRRTCQRRYLLRAFETACGPLSSERHSLTENMPLGGFSASLRHPNNLAAIGGFIRWVGRHICWMNLLDFSTSSIFQPKGQATPHAKLAPFVRPLPRYKAG
jgi:hypothetical protein